MIARVAASSLLLAVLVAGGCKDTISTDSAGASSTGGPESGVVCPGVAYTRTDVPGTALCLDGLDSFQCAWIGNNPAIKGYLVRGRHDAANNVLTLAYPDDPGHTSFTEYSFDTLFAVDGIDLVLKLMGVRAGDYHQVGSWAEAVDGDGGLCGGAGATCDGPCSADADCAGGQACIATVEGDKCLPIACDGCFDSDKSCNYYADTCDFDSCS